jgi:hypothetical protein
MNDTIRWVLTGSLLFSAYTMATCPCETACKCKYELFLVTTGLPLAYVLYDNMSS